MWSDPLDQLLERLRAQPAVDERSIAEEQCRRVLIVRLREREALRRQRDPLQLNAMRRQSPLDVRLATPRLGRDENADAGSA